MLEGTEASNALFGTAKIQENLGFVDWLTDIYSICFRNSKKSS